MKSFISVFIAAVALVFVVSPAYASDYASDELVPSKCDGIVGKAIIDVKQKVINDADSGVAGNYWAFDVYDKRIKVYATTATNTYCAIVKYDGEFVTIAGQSPQNTGTVEAGVEGDMYGGYRATIVGTLLPVPSKPVRGDIGKYDYQCDPTGNCPGQGASWLSFYFNPGYSFDYLWWGWKYTTENNGTWINQLPGNVGDITGLKVSNNDRDEQDNGQSNSEGILDRHAESFE